MKKTYINPEMEIVELQTEQPMLTVSGPDVVTGGSTSNVGDLLGREIDDLDW